MKEFSNNLLENIDQFLSLSYIQPGQEDIAFFEKGGLNFFSWTYLVSYQLEGRTEAIKTCLKWTEVGMIKMPSYPSRKKSFFVCLHFLLLPQEENVFLHSLKDLFYFIAMNYWNSMLYFELVFSVFFFPLSLPYKKFVWWELRVKELFWFSSSLSRFFIKTKC